MTWGVTSATLFGGVVDWGIECWGWVSLGDGIQQNNLSYERALRAVDVVMGQN